MKCGRTDSGLRYAVLRSGSAVGWCALTCGTGTRDEGSFPAGIAHFTEHTLFKGTRRKSASAINSCLERLGGELNAFTTKEEIVLHATVLKEDLRKAASLLLELATEAVFPDAAVETERGVVIDEIVSAKDSPADDVYDRFEEELFRGHPLGRSILGTAAAIRKTTPEQLRGFYAQGFRPGRMALTLVADIDEDRMEALVRTLSARFFPGGPVADGERTLAAPALSEPFHKTVDKRNHEVNAVLGGFAPGLYDGQKRIETILLCNLLGGPASNSMLNSLLRERYGWVYGVECNYTQYADSGIATVSFGCERPNLDRCLRKIDDVLRRCCEMALTEARLKAAKKQLLGQLLISAASGEAQALSMGKSLVVFGTVESQARTRERIEAVTARALLERAQEVFDPMRLSRLIFL